MRIALLLLLLLSSCLSPISIQRAVLAYDRTISDVETKMLLLNIARARHQRPTHFTAISNVAASFTFHVSAGIGPPGAGDSAYALTPSLGGSISESPTVSIVPIQGEEFTKRVLMPLDETKFLFVVAQNANLGLVLRLVAESITVDGKAQDEIALHKPAQRAAYVNFRTRVLHLSQLMSENHLFVGPVNYQEKWAGRVAITNYDLNSLSGRDQLEIFEASKTYPHNCVYVDIRPQFPGGDYPLRGCIMLRSFTSMLGFLARSIAEQPEFDVPKDPRTPGEPQNPVHTLEVHEANRAVANAAYEIDFEGKVYSIENADTYPKWNMQAFKLLYQVYQMTITDLAKVPAPLITIPK